MDPIKVIVENLPNPQPWCVAWAPVIIALCAVIVSIFSLCWSRAQYINSSRPFVWLTDFAVLNEKQQLLNKPQTVATKVTNAPAKIISAQYHFYFILGSEKREIHKHEDNNIVRFPDEKSQATYTVGKFEQLLKTQKSGEELERYLRIDYSALSGNKKYMYESRSKYDFQENRWRVISEKAL